MAKFKVGDRVRWVSQSQGYVREKGGEVVAVVKAGESVRPYVNRLEREGYNPRPMQGWWNLPPRKGTSYLVGVPTKSGRGRKRLYFPVASLLESAP